MRKFKALPLDFSLKFRYDRRILFKCREKEEYISHLKRERDPLAERFREGLLMEGSFGAVFLNRETGVFKDFRRTVGDTG